MNLSANVKDFKTALEHIQTAVKSKSTMEILKHALVRSVGSGKVKFTANDLVQVISYTIEAPNSGDIFATVEFEKLHKLTAKYKDDQTIKISFEEDHAKVSCARSKGKLSVLNPNDYPLPNDLEDDKKITFEGKSVLESIKKASAMAGQNDVRHYLNGVALDVKKDRMHVVATDGHRLIKIEVSCNSELEKDRVLIIPNDSIAGFIRCVEDKEVVMQVAHNFVRFSDEQVEFQTQLIEGRYPDYERVIPKANNLDFTFIGKEIKDAVSRASVFGNGKTTPLRLLVKDSECSITVSGGNNSQGNEYVNCVSDHEIEIGVNAQYLTDAVNKVESDEVVVWMKDDPSAPMLIKDGDTEMVVMPMRL